MRQNANVHGARDESSYDELLYVVFTHAGCTPLITLLTAVFGVALSALMLYLMRRDHLQISHGLGWTLVILVCSLMGFAPSLFDAVAMGIGVSYAPILGIALAIGALVIKALLTDIEISKLKTREQRLIQKVALLESEIRDVTGRPPIDD